MQELRTPDNSYEAGIMLIQVAVYAGTDIEYDTWPSTVEGQPVIAGYKPISCFLHASPEGPGTEKARRNVGLRQAGPPSLTTTSTMSTAIMHPSMSPMPAGTWQPPSMMTSMAIATKIGAQIRNHLNFNIANGRKERSLRGRVDERWGNALKDVRNPNLRIENKKNVEMHMSPHRHVV